MTAHTSPVDLAGALSLAAGAKWVHRRVLSLSRDQEYGLSPAPSLLRWRCSARLPTAAPSAGTAPHSLRPRVTLGPGISEVSATVRHIFPGKKLPLSGQTIPLIHLLITFSEEPGSVIVIEMNPQYRLIPCLQVHSLETDTEKE